MNVLIKAALNTSDKCKPVLVKLLPAKLLRGVRKRMLNAAIAKLEHAPLEPFARSANADGVNLIGYIKGETGLGQSCRLIAAGLEAARIDFTVYNFEYASSMRFKDTTWSSKITNETPLNINIIHVNPDELPRAFVQLGRKTWDKRYNIAFWLWELERFPLEWMNVLVLVDEIWTPSEFVSQNLRKITTKPVKTIPYALTTPIRGEYGRQDFNLPSNKFLFLCMYDRISTLERKNPLGAIKAFRQAFQQENDSVGLVIKINNTDQKDLSIINEKLAGCKNIYILHGTYDKIKVNALIASVDAYISLHRSEGFGLVMAEAMLLGTPVIATNWSGNTEFMDDTMACMVDYEFTVIKADHGPYKAGSRWAEPDTAHAAGHMKKLFADEKFRVELAKKAKTHAKSHFSPERIAAMMKKRILEIYESEGSERVLEMYGSEGNL